MDKRTLNTDTTSFRRAAIDASDAQITALIDEVRSALEGDSNDAEHDALVSVAGFFSIAYEPAED